MAARKAAGSSSRRPGKRPSKPKAPPKDPITWWAKEVVAGRIVAGPHVRNACRRHLQDLVEGPKRGLVWDLDAALNVIAFFEEELYLGGGQFEDKPFLLHPSQKFKTGSLFGWKRGDGTRRFRRFFDEEAKGNGKSPWLAGIGHYCLLADDEARAEVYAAAADKDQAMVMFRDAVSMYEQSPNIFDRLTPSGVNPVWNLADVSTGSFFRPISAEKRKKGSGPRPSCALCDEVHEHPDGLMIEMLERGFKFRRQPLLGMATNSGSNRSTVCWDEHVNAIRAAAGSRDADHDRHDYVGDLEAAVFYDDTFSFVCSLDKDDDPIEDPACWRKANMLLGTTITEEYLAGVVRQAKQLPGKLNNILRLHFCVWTDADTAWMSRPTLEACLDDFEPDTELSGEDLFIGADLSASQDITALGFVVPTGFKDVVRTDKEGVEKTVRLPTYDAWVEGWTPLDTLDERAARDQQPYATWVRDGHLNAPPGKIIRMDFVAARAAEVAAEFDVKALAYDRYAFRKNFEPELDAMGLTLPLVEHPQGGKRRAKLTDEQIEMAKAEGKDAEGLWMPGSLVELETLILEQRIRLRRSPLLISAFMGASIERDPFDNRWFSKRKATTRIDALVALAMAVGAATSGAVPGPGGSIYDMAAAWAPLPPQGAGR